MSPLWQSPDRTGIAPSTDPREQVNPVLWRRSRLRAAMVAFPMTATVVLSQATPARALDVAQLVEIAKGAYQAYKLFSEKRELTLDQATTRIINAVNNARDDTIARINNLQVSDVKACANSAIVGVVDIPRMTLTAKQQFAASSLDCVSKNVQALQDQTDKARVDQLGFALNTVGPIALLARMQSNLTTPALQSLITQGNNLVVSTLAPVCRIETQVELDARGKPIPDAAQHTITCEVYPGHRGVDSAEGRIPPGGLDTSRARTLAARNTSHPIAVASLTALSS